MRRPTDMCRASSRSDGETRGQVHRRQRYGAGEITEAAVQPAYATGTLHSFTLFFSADD